MPEEKKSKWHGANSDGHGPDEHGLGAEPSPEDPRDYPFRSFIAGVAERAGSSEDHIASITPPTYYYVPNVPPVDNQGSTPQCVAYSSAYGQKHIDRPEWGSYPYLGQAKFFAQIGGTAAGAYMRDALERRLHFGYPKPDGTLAASHRISAYYAVPKTISAVQQAIILSPTNGDVLVIGPWFHSWFHASTTSGKLPAPDYDVGGHAWWVRGYNAYGVRARNSWGPNYGLGGDFYMSWAQLTSRMWEIWRTRDN